MSVAILGFPFRLVIDGESFEFQNIADIEKLPKEKAMQILEHLIFVERPALLLEASKIPQLQETITNLTAEKDFFFKKTQRIEDLSVKIVQYHNENELLVQEINILKKSVEDVNKQYQDVSVELSRVTARLDEVIQPISARQMATNADNAAMEAIFPKCRQKPYCIRSYSNLLSFLLKPESDEFTGPFAPQAWLELSEDERLAIKSRADQLANSYPYLKVSIKTLKEEAWKQAHSTTTVEETLHFYQQKGDDIACEALNVCALYLGLTSTAEASETDGAGDVK